jgi:hypothetical protein
VGPLGFDKRKEERGSTLITQAITIRAILRLLAGWHEVNKANGHVGNWDRWRPNLRRLREVRKFNVGDVRAECTFLSRLNPIFYATPGGGIYAMSKAAQARKTAAEAAKQSFVINPLEDLTVQNMKGSIEFMYTQLRAFLGDRPSSSGDNGDGHTKRRNASPAKVSAKRTK